jgi:hypothetical protein
MTRAATHAALLIAAALLVSCAAEPDRAGDLPTAPAGFKEAERAPTQATALPMPAEGAWWKIFADPTLDDLVARADKRNWSIRLANARLEQAKASVKASKASRAPLVSAGLNATDQEGPLTNAAGNSGTLFVGAVNSSTTRSTCSAVSHAKPKPRRSMPANAKRCSAARDWRRRPTSHRPISRCARSTPSARACATPPVSNAMRSG